MRAWLKPKSLRWRFMLPPILGASLILILAVILTQISKTELAQMDRLHALGYRYIQTITDLSSALATNHAEIYKLLDKAEDYSDEGEFYLDSKNFLNEVHRIRNALETETAAMELTPEEARAVAVLSDQLSQYLVTAANAMLMATVDQAQTRTVMIDATSRFNGLNAAFLSLNKTISTRVDQQILAAKQRMRDQNQVFALLFIGAAALMLITGFIFSKILSADLRELIDRLDGILTRNTGSGSKMPEKAGVIDTLTSAIDRVTDNYSILEKTQNELTRVNDDLTETVDRQKGLIEAQRMAEDARDRALEDAQRANEAKTEFLANMSHELRTPLNAIIGFSDIIRTAMLGPISKRYQEYADNISTAGGHLLELLTDILDISRIEAGKFDVKKETVDIQDTFEACRTLLRVRLNNAGVGLDMSVPENFPCLLSDTLRIRQALTNVIDNAIKFSPMGADVKVSASLTDDGCIVFVISDNGIGIAEDDIPKILENFGQVRSSAQHAHGGTGLGLPIAKSLVELMDGEMEIDSTLGKGTTVRMTFSESCTTCPPDRNVTHK